MITINKDLSSNIILDLHSVVTLKNPYYVFKFVDANKLYTISSIVEDKSLTPQRYSQFVLDPSVLLAMHSGESTYQVYETLTRTTDPSSLHLIWTDNYQCITTKEYVTEVFYNGVDPSNNYDAPEYIYGEDSTIYPWTEPIQIIRN